MFKRWHRDETNQRTDLKLNRTNQPLGHTGFFFWLQRIIEADMSEPVGIQYSILSPAAVTWPRCSASAIPRGNQPLCGVLLPRSSIGSGTDGIPKGSDVWGRLEPPGIGGLSSQYTPPESGSAEPTAEAPVVSSAVRGSAGTGSEETRTGVLRRRDRRAKGALKSALPSPADARSCSGEVNSPLPSPVQQWRLFLAYACCSCVLLLF